MGAYTSSPRWGKKLSKNYNRRYKATTGINTTLDMHKFKYPRVGDLVSHSNGLLYLVLDVLEDKSLLVGHIDWTMNLKTLVQMDKILRHHNCIEPRKLCLIMRVSPGLDWQESATLLHRKWTGSGIANQYRDQTIKTL